MPMLIDLHVHSSASPCSNLGLDDILQHAAGRGLDGVAVTDHHCLEVLNTVDPGRQPNGLFLFVGQEYQTEEGDFLVFGPTAPMDPDLAARQLLDAVADAGGVAIAAHPLRQARPTAEYLLRHKMCSIVESINGRNQPWENRGAGRWQARYDLTACGGSDAHSLEELGRAATRFHDPVHTTADLIHALRQGRCEPHCNGHAFELL